MAGSLRLVVAAYDEDLSWLKQVDKKWEISVIRKDKDIPNVGREASSFLYAMEKFYEDDGWICFLQGDPFHHCTNILNLLNNIRDYYLIFIPLSDKVLQTYANGGPYDRNLPVKEWHERWIGKWPGNIAFAPGGQFITPAAWIRSRTLEELREARTAVEELDVGAYTMERLWHPYLTW